MAAEKIVAALFVCVFVLGSVNSQSCEYPPCSSVPQGVSFFYPNWDDCSTYWKCSNQVATRMSCPPGQTFDFFTFQCKQRPTIDTLATNPVFSCEILLNGVESLAQQG